MPTLKILSIFSADDVNIVLKNSVSLLHFPRISLIVYLFSAKGKIACQEETIYSNSYCGKMKKKRKDKEKHSNKKAVKCGLDVDKDIDEREEAVPKHAKEKKSKRKWF